MVIKQRRQRGMEAKGQRGMEAKGQRGKGAERHGGKGAERHGGKGAWRQRGKETERLRDGDGEAQSTSTFGVQHSAFIISNFFLRSDTQRTLSLVQRRDENR